MSQEKHSETLRDSAVESSRGRALEQLGRSEVLRQQAAGFAGDAVQHAERKQKELVAQLPDLRQAVEAATDPESRQAAAADYLEAIQHRHSLEQAWQLGRRQGLQLGELASDTKKSKQK